jgi:synaptobrevin family protein YKT6
MICSAENLEGISIWKRGSVREVVRFAGREVVKRTPIGQRQSTEHLNYRCHTYVSEDCIGVAVLSTYEYPHRVAHDLITIVFERFCDTNYYRTNSTRFASQTRDLDFKGFDSTMNELLEQYRAPEKVDNILMIHNELEETKGIILNSLDKLLDRGDRLDDLLDRTSDLSFATKQFAKRADDLNKCCTWL